MAEIGAVTDSRNLEIITQKRKRHIQSYMWILN